MRSLFLQAPSFDGYDGGAGARYQMKREVKSFWYPTWLAQAAAMVEGSKLIDAPPHGLKFADIVEDVKAHDLIVIHTSTPSFKSDCKTAGMIREFNPKAIIGFIGAKVAVEPEESLKACPAIDFVARNEYEFTIKELAEGRDWSTIKGMSYRNKDGAIVHNPEREILMDMDQLPSVLPLYKQLDTQKYFGGYLKHPYISYYTGPRLQIALHLLPVAANHRRAQIPLPFDRARGRGCEIHPEEFPRSEGNLLRRRHADRQPRSR